jgi:prevent-host-death family protein
MCQALAGFAHVGFFVFSHHLDRTSVSTILVIQAITINYKAIKMLKKISAMKVRQNLGQVMNEVALRGDDYVVERAGKPLVAIIPMEKYRKLQQDLDDFWEEVSSFQESVKDVDPKELDAAIEEAVIAAKRVTARELKASEI